MEVLLENISRSFGRQRVVVNLTQRFASGSTYAILGGNGSGKSTILQMVLGSLTPSAGNISYHLRNKELKRENVAFKISLASPYLELIEELTALEFLNFYSTFRPLRRSLSNQEFLEIARLQDSSDKQIRNFSSGMRQRLRLAMALLSESELILLDEPASNLDPEGVAWYRELVETERAGRTLLVGSNFDQREMDFCKHQLKNWQ